MWRGAGLLPEDDVMRQGADGRRDLRDALVFTIDPEDARDHDDALSVRSAGGGLWEVGVHIADVGHYVEQDGVIDRAAFERGCPRTSARSVRMRTGWRSRSS